MGEKSVTISIAGRTYPIKVDAAEETFVHDAADRINKSVSQIEKGSVIKDKQDLLALTALQFATQYLEAQTKVIDNKEEIISSLIEVDELLGAHLAKSKAV